MVIDKMTTQPQHANLTAIKDTGLRGILVADTRICLIDGEKGELAYRGYDIHDLAAYSADEEVAYLLLYGSLPTPQQIEDFSKSLTSQRKLSPVIVEILEKLPKTAAPMAVLQAIIALLAHFDSEEGEDSKEANLRCARQLIATLPTMVAYWDRIRKNLSPI